MDFKSFKSREVHNGIQYIHFFPNGYGVSIVRHDLSYSSKNTWELAVLVGSEAGWDLCYTTPITSDVLSELTDSKVNETCIAISNLNEIVYE